MRKFRGQVHLNFRFSEHLGPRIDEGGVSLRLETSDSYLFVVSAQWPEEDFNKAVERGVRDGLSEGGVDPDLGVRIVLEGVDYDRVNSSEHTFYLAAKGAALARAGMRRGPAA